MTEWRVFRTLEDTPPSDHIAVVGAVQQAAERQMRFAGRGGTADGADLGLVHAPAQGVQPPAAGQGDVDVALL